MTLAPRLEDLPHYVRLSPELATGGQPSETQLARIAAAGFHSVINLGVNDPAYALPDEERCVVALGLQYAHIPVPFSAPHQAQLETFFAAMQRMPSPIFVHCRHNKRVPAFVTLYRICVLKWPVPRALDAMRQLWEPDAVWRTFINDVLASAGHHERL